MIAKSELPNIDWNNPDVIKLFEYVTGRFERVERDNEQLNEVNHQIEMKYRISQSENEQLRAQIAKLMGSQDSKTVANATLKDATNTDSTPVEEDKTLPKKDSSQKARSYNKRTFTGYPHIESPKKLIPSSVTPQEYQRTVDQEFCHVCGSRVSE